MFGFGKKRVSQPPIVVNIDGTGSFNIPVVGESKYQEAIAAVAGPKTPDGVEHLCVATLRREPENPFDPNAVAVLIEGRKVGYLSRDMAKIACGLLDHNGTGSVEGVARAIIKGGWRRPGSEGHYGVYLDVG